MLTECPECRYSLAGLPANHRCPECGFEYDETMQLFRPRWRWLMVLAIAFTVLTLPFTVWFLSWAYSSGSLTPAAIGVSNMIVAAAIWSRVRPRRRREYLLVGHERIVWRMQRQHNDIPWADVTDVKYSDAFGYVRIKLSRFRGRDIPPYLYRPLGPGPAVARHFRQLAQDARRAADPRYHPG